MPELCSVLKMWKHLMRLFSAALANQQGRQPVSMECLDTQCEEYFRFENVPIKKFL
jgi:hypothetical protein